MADHESDSGAGQRSTAVVGLVASAGGLLALELVLSRLPADTDAAVIVLLHQRPGQESQLTRILQRQTPWPVSVAVDGAALNAREVLVIGPGCHLLVLKDLSVATIVAGEFPPSRPSADLMLSTLATAAGSDAFAVVLSGNGHDGATGATAVHHCGGTVIASDEASSEQFSMPRATIERDNAIDHVVAVGDIGKLLGRLVAARAG